MSMKIEVNLPADRTKTGTLKLIDNTTGLTLFGPVSVLGRAARNDATAHGNPTRDSLKPYGDTPLGTYAVVSILANGEGTSRPVAQYGQSGSIRLDPTGGDAAKAKANGRTGLLIHAGRHAFSSLIEPKALKPTNGCIRMRDWDMQGLIDVIRANGLLFPGTLSVNIGPQGVTADIDESISDRDPPPLEGGTILP
jgi:hypothetical protein